MVSFRFYLVSITAMFLALAVGITMGATVIDRATVDLLRTQIRTAQAQRRATSEQNSVLKQQLDDQNNFNRQVVARFAEGVLTGVPVLIVDVQGQGINKNVEDLSQVLFQAGADVQGQLDFTRAMQLDKGDDTVTKLASQLGLSGSLQPDDVRKNALLKLVQWLAAPPTAAEAATAGKTPVEVMKGMGLLDQVPNKPLSASTRFIVVSGATPDVPNEQLATPFSTALTLQTNGRVVAAEAGAAAEPEATPTPKPAVREVFVGPLRADASVKGKLSTVDNIEDVYGRVAAVYALRNLPNLWGHYGVGPHASDGPVPGKP